MSTILSDSPSISLMFSIRYCNQVYVLAALRVRRCIKDISYPRTDSRCKLFRTSDSMTHSCRNQCNLLCHIHIIHFTLGLLPKYMNSLLISSRDLSGISSRSNIVSSCVPNLCDRRHRAYRVTSSVKCIDWSFVFLSRSRSIALQHDSSTILHISVFSRLWYLDQDHDFRRDHLTGAWSRTTWLPVTVIITPRDGLETNSLLHRNNYKILKLDEDKRSIDSMDPLLHDFCSAT